MGISDEVSVFVDTNLDTHLALSVSRDITAGELKGIEEHKAKTMRRNSLTGKLRMLHFSCFPELGKIKVHGLMVKRKSALYHLSDSMAIKHIFDKLSVSASWLLCLDASTATECMNGVPGHVEKRAEICYKNTDRESTEKRNIFENCNQVKSDEHAENRETRSSLAPAFHTPESGKANWDDESIISELPVEGDKRERVCKSCDTISVTGIISRFFSDIDEVDSHYCQAKDIQKTTQAYKTELIHSNIGEPVASEANTLGSTAGQQQESALKAKRKRLGSRKAVNKKPPRMYMESSNCKSGKYQVGKRLVRAAKGIQDSKRGSRPSSAGFLLSRCKSLTGFDSALLIRRIAFDAKEFDD